MSTTPPEQPSTSTQQQGMSRGPGGTSNLNLNLGGTWPTLGNAEAVVYVLVLLFLVIIWAASDALGADDFSVLLTVLTAFYLLSRGIAKASRVLER